MNYKVIVSNIGLVYNGSDENLARRTFEEYKWQSQRNYGRAAGECVTLMDSENILCEFTGSLARVVGW